MHHNSQRRECELIQIDAEINSINETIAQHVRHAVNQERTA